MALVCPVCRLDMQAITVEDLELDYCRMCGGLWFDPGELEKILNRTNLPKRVLEPVAYDLTRRKVGEGERICPRCSVVMKVINYQDTPVDVCTACKGMWFDRYEVAMVSGKGDIVPWAVLDERTQKSAAPAPDGEGVSTPGYGGASLSPYSDVVGSDVGGAPGPSLFSQLFLDILWFIFR